MRAMKTKGSSYCRVHISGGATGIPAVLRAGLSDVRGAQGGGEGDGQRATATHGEGDGAADERRVGGLAKEAPRSGGKEEGAHGGEVQDMVRLQ